MTIKEKKYKKFLSYFRYLNAAGSNISENIESQKVVHNIIEIEQLITQGYDSLINALNEIRRNLYLMPTENQESYLIRILKGFHTIAPYFNFYLDKKYEREFGKEVVIIDNESFPTSILTVHHIIKQYVNNFGRYQLDDNVKEISEEYIILCFRRFVDFFNHLDTLCHDFDIDLVDIQKKSKVHIWGMQKNYSENLGDTGETTYMNKEKNQQKERDFEQSEKKIPAKYYALYHWILIEMGTEKGFERNENDQYVKHEIESYARQRYPGISDQGFYREFISIDITKRTDIARNFGKGYKQKIIRISDNDAKIIAYLNKFPN